MIPTLSIISLITAIAALWAILRTTDSLLTLVGLGVAIIFCLLSFNFSPLPGQFLIVLTVIALDKLQVFTRG